MGAITRPDADHDRAMQAPAPGTVTLTKRCKLHGISLPESGSVTQSFQAAFPDAIFNEEKQEWQVRWERETFEDFQRCLDDFFEKNSVMIDHIDKC